LFPNFSIDIKSLFAKANGSNSSNPMPHPNIVDEQGEEEPQYREDVQIDV
jgi:hypothetical protein